MCIPVFWCKHRCSVWIFWPIASITKSHFPLRGSGLPPTLHAAKFSSSLHTFLVPSSHHLFSPRVLKHQQPSFFSLTGGQIRDLPTFLALLEGTPLPPASGQSYGSPCRAGFRYRWPISEGKAHNFSANSVNTNLKYLLLQDIIKAKEWDIHYRDNLWAFNIFS